jgi:hypothetical protein
MNRYIRKPFQVEVATKSPLQPGEAFFTCHRWVVFKNAEPVAYFSNAAAAATTAEFVQGTVWGPASHYGDRDDTSKR